MIDYGWTEHGRIGRCGCCGTEQREGDHLYGSGAYCSEACEAAANEDIDRYIQARKLGRHQSDFHPIDPHIVQNSWFSYASDLLKSRWP